jgi:hypothetical protein
LLNFFNEGKDFGFEVIDNFPIMLLINYLFLVLFFLNKGE